MGKSNLGKKEPPVISSGRSRDGKEQDETENIRVPEHSKQLSLMAGAHSVSEAPVFPVDGQLLMVLPRAGASVKNPDVQLPILRSDEDGYYLEMRVEADSRETSEVAVTRRVLLDDLTSEEWEDLKAQYANLDLQACTDQGTMP